MSLAEALTKMKNGDCLAFSGTGILSDAIRWLTRSNVSHVGAVLMIEGVLHVAESTTLNSKGFQGVDIVPLADRLVDYGTGPLWWLPLTANARKALKEDAWAEYMRAAKAKQYGRFQALLAGLGIPQPGLSKRVFCSEYLAFGYMAGGMYALTGWRENPSTLTPEELIRLTTDDGTPLFDFAFSIGKTFTRIKVLK